MPTTNIVFSFIFFFYIYLLNYLFMHFHITIFKACANSHMHCIVITVHSTCSIELNAEWGVFSVSPMQGTPNIYIYIYI
jgi:hypothetical protein